ncbi:hypothetical protein PILCRDRAFT_809863 [Piloderma croceum F 1598]|uniref:Uncharacterized protein n=1 Tax=Piloderma croceum (strain F 1598) TaxID=765440 RepID=A0A0C3CQE6_PILCF|nr:hypothetical protein PILCRDRAFT_809863 [Piloderma croceum F 1598]
MASEDQLNFVGPHAPHDKAIEAFRTVEKQIKHAIIHSRRDWDKHEIKMWSRASSLSDEQLVAFTFTHERSKYDNATHGRRGDGGDLVLVDNAATSYGEIILGKIRIPAIEDGYIHVRIHDPPNRGEEDVIFHSLFTDEGHKDADGHPKSWDAIQWESTPLKFFNE